MHDDLNLIPVLEWILIILLYYMAELISVVVRERAPLLIMKACLESTVSFALSVPNPPCLSPCLFGIRRVFRPLFGIHHVFRSV